LKPSDLSHSNIKEIPESKTLDTTPYILRGMGNLESLMEKEKLLSYILGSMEEAIILVDHNLHVRYMNQFAEHMLSFQGKSYEGKHIFNDLNAWEIPGGKSKVQQVLDTGKGIRGVIRKLHNQKLVSINIVPLADHGERTGVLIVGQDITETVEMQQELDKAFALTLPNK
jgi:PAS domain S-box-containing protein